MVRCLFVPGSQPHALVFLLPEASKFGRAFVMNCTEAETNVASHLEALVAMELGEVVLGREQKRSVSWM